MSEYESKLAAQRNTVIAFIKRCLEESRINEKIPRRPQNTLNWNYYYGTIDWSHKRPEDPRVHLHKVGVAAERMRSKFKQALMKYDEWLTVEREYLPPNAVLPDFVAKNLLVKQFDRCKAKVVLSDAILRGALEGIMTIKVGGEYVTKPRFVSEAGKLVRKEEKVWQLKLSVVPYEGYHFDNTVDGSDLYRIEECRTNKASLLKMSSKETSPDKPFEEETIKKLQGMAETQADSAERAAKNDYLSGPQLKERNSVLVHNFYGTILSDDGSVFEWEYEDGKKFPLENIVCIMANEEVLILDPKRNVRWSGKAPYISADPLRSPKRGRKALMDAGTLVNQADDELFSLMLAGAIKSVHNVSWYRKTWFADKRDASGGVRDGAQISIDDSCPPNGVPMGVMKTGEVPQEAFTMQGTLDRVFAENVISNQLDLSGTLPGKQVRATEATLANNSISDVFDSMASDIEEVVINETATESLYEIVQNIDEMDPEEVKSCFEDRQDLAAQFLEMSDKERFDQVSGAFRFQGKGLHGLISNQAVGQSLINMLSTLTANPATATQLETAVSMPKLVKKLIKGFKLDPEELAPSPEELKLIEQKQLIREQAMAQAEMMQNAPKDGGSQSPQSSQPMGNGGTLPGSGAGGM